MKTKNSQKIINSSKGQVSLFMAIVFVFFLTLVAFVINIGLFVKAKINLQNAVDAAAWSGAAVQARQLTDISYLNYEMHNVYKEWMFKYYVLGNLSNPAIRNAEEEGKVDFRLKQLSQSSTGRDLFNVPSICVGLTDKADLCSIYSTPGLPRPQSLDVLGIADLTRDIENAIVQLAAEACSRKTYVNYTTALQWAFGFGQKIYNLDDKLPEVAFERPGAWTKAMELALRVRNLEGIMNQAPYQDGVCKNSQNGCRDISEIEGDVGNERAVKAFYSAYRNLGNNVDREMKDSLIITELAPKPKINSNNSDLSALLIPASSRANSKYYLDLKLTPINFAYFYSALIPEDQNQGSEQAGCTTSKVAMPVPAYPFGFIKNPQVLTYYSVKGEAEFNGLFNPFSTSIKLTAYASAKPFGGRVGPHLFDALTFDSAVKPRANTQGGNFFRSSPFTMGLKPVQNANLTNKFPPIMPFNQDFWVQNAGDVIGGTQGSEGIKYAHPNMLYLQSEDPYYNQSIYSVPIPGLPNSTGDYEVGLYNKDQLRGLKSNIENISSPNAAEINEAITKSRYPTDYDSQNYLIPQKTNPKLDYYGNPDNKLYVYAPLFGQSLVYQSSDELVETVQSYFETQKGSIQSFVSDLKEVSEKLASQTTTIGDIRLYEGIAKKIHDSPLTCSSIAGQLDYFFLGQDSSTSGGEKCSESFYSVMSKYYQNFANNSQGVNFYYSDTPIQSEDKKSELESNTAFFPGSASGGLDNSSGIIPHPFLSTNTKSLRNFYSTKLISFSSILDSNFEFTYSEGKGSGVASRQFYSNIQNTLENSVELQKVAH